MSTGAQTNDRSEYAEHDLRNTEGHGYRMYRLQGLYLLIVPQADPQEPHQIDKMKDLRTLSLKDDDVMVFAYPKCGTHWTWEMMEMLRGGQIQFRPELKETRELEFIYNEGVEAIPSPRILNTHLPLRLAPEDLTKKKLRCVHVMRNPKDVCVSFFNHVSKAMPPETYDGTFAEFREQFLAGELPFGSYGDYILDWEAETVQHPELPVLNLYYEDLKHDTLECVRRLATFLDVAVSDSYCQQVVDACSFSRMKEFDQHKTELPFQLWQENSGGTFYRKGEIGDWKNWFTVAESERFDEIWNEKMKNSKFKFTYSSR